MALSHRARLVLASAGSSGLLFIVIFAICVVGLRSSEINAAQSKLRPAVSQVVGDYAAGESDPDLAEIIQASPEISLTVFDGTGRIIVKGGKLSLPFTKRSGLRDGLALSASVYKDKTVVAGLDWSQHKDFLDRFELACILLWLPLVGMVALTTWLTARSTFLPLSKLAREAESLSVESLSARLHVETSGEYREFAQRLNRFLERLEASVRREELFISDAAHELRTPLTVLRGQVESVLRRNRTDVEYRSTLELVLDETNRLSALVELLLRSAVPLDDTVPQSDLSQAAEGAHARWVDRFSTKNVQLELISLPAQVKAESAELDVIIDNLLANALRASGSGSTCIIEIQTTSSEGVLTVSDEGVGIGPEDAERMFERFARAKSQGKGEDGFGIGLALCKRIVESRGGRIWTERNSPSGARFSVSLPLS